jgi:hypothetical protein
LPDSRLDTVTSRAPLPASSWVSPSDMVPTSLPARAFTNAVRSAEAVAVERVDRKLPTVAPRSGLEE